MNYRSVHERLVTQASTMELLMPAREKRCAKCGAPFLCGPQDGRETCWCNDAPAISPDPGLDCLCRSCIAAIADRAALEAGAPID
jgi:hypothetical protein